MASPNVVVNTKMDLFTRPSLQMWVPVTIAGITDKQYGFLFDDMNDIVWWDKEDAKYNLAPLHTYSVPTTLLPIAPPLKLMSHTSSLFRKSASYKHKNKHFILLCLDYEVHQYDIVESKWEKLCDYPDEFEVDRLHQISFDSKELQLHIVSISDEDSKDYLTIVSYARLDIKSMEWTTKTGECELLYEVDDPLEQFSFGIQHLPHPSGQTLLYLMSTETAFFILDDHSDGGLTVTEVYEHGVNGHCKGNLVYSNTFSKLFFDICGNLFFADFDTQWQGKMDSLNIEWSPETKMNVEWNAQFNYYDFTRHFIFAYDHIMFVIEPGQIYCIDLRHDKMYRVIKSFPKDFSMTEPRISVVRVCNDLYILDPLEKTIKFSMLDLIPNELDDLYRNQHGNPLIFGYISRLNKEKNLSSTISVDIARLILSFYPVFYEC